MQIYFYKQFINQRFLMETIFNNTSQYFKIKSLFKLAFLLMLLQASYSKQYILAYIFQNSSSLLENIPKNNILIYERARYDAEVFLHEQSRLKYQSIKSFNNSPSLAQSTELSVKIFQQLNLTGQLKIQKSTTPHNIYKKHKQIIPIHIDMSTFDNISSLNEQRYKILFEHKGQSIFIINSKQINTTIKKQIDSIFKISQNNHTICKINMRKHTMQQNRDKIKQCYENNRIKKLKLNYNVGIMSMIQGFGLYALVYILIVAGITFTSPYVMIYLFNKQKDKHSVV